MAATLISVALRTSIGASRVRAQDPEAMRSAAARSLFERGLGRRVIGSAALDTTEGVDAEVVIHLPPPDGATALLDPW